MQHILVPIFICVVLPVAIVLIAAAVKMNGQNKRSEVLLKALDSANGVDVDKLMRMMENRDDHKGHHSKNRTPQEHQSRRLLHGCLWTLIGLVLVIYNGTAISIGGDMLNFNSDLIWLGGISIAVGVSFLIVYTVNACQMRKQAQQELSMTESCEDEAVKE